jgi:DNA primase
MCTRDYGPSVHNVKSASAPLVDVAERYTRLRRSTRDTKGLRSSHTEKTPSFHIYRINEGPLRQRFCRFGCGAKGDVVDFLCRAEERTTGEVIRHIADLAGLSQKPSGGLAARQGGSAWGRWCSSH